MIYSPRAPVSIYAWMVVGAVLDGFITRTQNFHIDIVYLYISNINQILHIPLNTNIIYLYISNIYPTSYYPGIPKYPILYPPGYNIRIIYLITHDLLFIFEIWKWLNVHGSQTSSSYTFSPYRQTYIPIYPIISPPHSHLSSSLFPYSLFSWIIFLPTD